MDQVANRSALPFDLHTRGLSTVGPRETDSGEGLESCGARLALPQSRLVGGTPDLRDRRTEGFSCGRRPPPRWRSRQHPPSSR